jgi:hypothetical protein
LFRISSGQGNTEKGFVPSEVDIQHLQRIRQTRTHAVIVNGFEAMRSASDPMRS